MTGVENTGVYAIIKINKDQITEFPFSFEGMQKKYPDMSVNSLNISSVQGSKEAFNDMLDFFVDRIPDSGLDEL